MVTSIVRQERWTDVVSEIGDLWQAHYDEIGTDKDRIPLAPDLEGYQTLDGSGRLHIVSARRDGVLIGYIFALVGAHLHYRTTLFANLDIYYIAPACRRGALALRMFREMERSLKARGVVKVIGNTKLAHDRARLFEALGWREAERIFTKVIA